MPTKKCSKCGWEVAHTYRATICPVCGTRYVDGPCRVCGKYSKRLVNGTHCVSCYREQYKIADATRDWRKRKRAESDAAYAAWLDKIAALPKDYPTLTQEQWLRACAHFNGCAFCGAASIDARVYFIPFKAGGRYCDWNIVPACEKCAVRIKLMPNTFAYLERAPERDKLLGIIKYLEAILDAAVEKATGSTEHTDC